jgi:PRD1 phage membrane DNA delivery
MSNVGPTLITILGGIFTLAMVAVIVSQKANTPAVFTGAGTALSSVINAAVSPLGSGSPLSTSGNNGIGGLAGAPAG